MEKKDARKLKPEVQHELRKQTIRPRKTGIKQKQIAEILGVYLRKIGLFCHPATPAYSLQAFAINH